MSETKKTDLWRRPPISTGHITGLEDASVVSTELLPPNIIKDIVVNTDTTLLEQKHRALFSADFMKDIQMTVFRKDTGVLVPDYGRRSVVMAYTEIPVAESFLYSVITSKGNFLSGSFYAKDLPNEDHTPWGFFGHRDAEKELNIGNSLLHEGFRAGLVLGYAVLDPKLLKDWLYQRWKHDVARFLYVEKGIDKVVENGDYPVVMFRLAGSTFRLVSRHENYRAQARVSAELARVSRVFNRELAVFPEKYQSSGLDSEKTRTALNLFANRSKFNQSDFESYLDFVSVIFAANAKGFPKFIISQGKKGIYFDLLNSVDALTYAKDIDYAFVTQDFEEIATSKNLFDLVEESNILESMYISKVVKKMTDPLIHLYSDSGRYIGVPASYDKLKLSLDKSIRDKLRSQYRSS